MATYKHTEEVSEMVKKVIIPESHDISLSAEEVSGLRALLGYGVSSETMSKLGLRSLYNQLCKPVSWDTLVTENPGFEGIATHKGIY